MSSRGELAPSHLTFRHLDFRFARESLQNISHAVKLKAIPGIKLLFTDHELTNKTKRKIFQFTEKKINGTVIHIKQLV